MKETSFQSKFITKNNQIIPVPPTQCFALPRTAPFLDCDLKLVNFQHFLSKWFQLIEKSDKVKREWTILLKSQSLQNKMLLLRSFCCGTFCSHVINGQKLLNIISMGRRSHCNEKSLSWKMLSCSENTHILCKGNQLSLFA